MLYAIATQETSEFTVHRGIRTSSTWFVGFQFPAWIDISKPASLIQPKSMYVLYVALRNGSTNDLLMLTEESELIIRVEVNIPLTLIRSIFRVEENIIPHPNFDLNYSPSLCLKYNTEISECKRFYNHVTNSEKGVSFRTPRNPFYLLLGVNILFAIIYFMSKGQIS